MYYEDTDAGGVVYHANYLRYCERARGEWLRELGFAPESIRRLHGVAFAVRRAAVEYARPAVLDDLLSIESEIVKMGKTSIFFRHDFFRRRKPRRFGARRGFGRLRRAAPRVGADGFSRAPDSARNR